MTVEVLPDGGVKITGTLQEVNVLSRNVHVALRNGFSAARFVTDDGVAEFVIATDLPETTEFLIEEKPVGSAG